MPQTQNKINQSYLKIDKYNNSIGSYDDGAYINFGAKTPKHITFEMYTENQEIESCDLRLTTINTTTTTAEKLDKVQWQDVAFFRFGYFYY